MDPLSIAASAAGLLGLVLQLGQYAQSIKGARKERVQFLQELERLNPLLKRLETHADSNEPWTKNAKEIGKILALLEKQLREIEPDLKPAEGFRSIKQRMLWILEKADFQEKVMNFGRSVVLIRHYVGEDHFDLSKDTNAQVQEGNKTGSETNAVAKDIQSTGVDTNTRIKNSEKTGAETQLDVKEVLADGKQSMAAIEILSREVLLENQKKRVRAEYKERLEISEWLSPHDFLAIQKNLFGKSYPLGKWLLDSEEFQIWTRGRPWQLRLWGDAGAGKTRLCSILVNYLQEKFDPTTTPVICMYCMYLSNTSRNEDQQKADILGGLLKQLIQQRKTDVGPESLREAHRRDKIRRAKPGVKELRKFLLEEIACYQRVIIVIDALDECNESTRQWLKYLLEEFQKEHMQNVSILATERRPLLLSSGEVTCHICSKTEEHRPLKIYWRCRQCPEPEDFDICQQCKEKNVTCGKDFHELYEPNEMIEVQVITPREELKIFVKGEIAKEIGSNTIRDLRKYPSQLSTSFGARLRTNSALSDKVVTEIVRRAEGRFLFASLYWDSLKRQRTTAAIEVTLGNFPKSIDKLYEDAMEERILKQDTEENAQLAIKIMRILCGAKQNLNLEELQHALATEKGDTSFVFGRDWTTDDILDVTKGFVTIVMTEVPTVRFFHATFDAYLRKTRDRWFPGIENEMATLCLTYLNFEPLTNRYRRVREYEATRSQYPFLPYAAQYWGDHAREAGKDTDLEKAVHNYLQDSEKATASMQAAWCGQTEGSTNWELPRSLNGLHIIAWFGLSMTEEDESLDVNFEEPYSGQTPLMWACRRGHDGVVRQLLRMGADVNVVDINGKTSLWEAVDNGNQAVVVALLEIPELEINAVNPKQSNRTALMHASRLGNVDIVRNLLLFAGVDVNQQDSIGFTALSTAAAFAQLEVLTELILTPDIDLNIVTNDTKHSALTIAALRDNAEDIVEQLLSHGADAILKDNDGGGTAILRAAERGSLAIVQRMLDHNVDYMCTDNDGRTVLHGACGTSYADQDLIELLLQVGLSVDVRDNHGCTPLHEASQNGITTAVEALLYHGADPDLKDSFGRTCYTVALQYAEHEVMDLLRAKLVEIYGAEAVEKKCAQEYEKLPVWALVNLRREDLIDKAISERPNSLTEREPISKDTALHRAVQLFSEDSILEKLLLHMSSNGRNRNERTPLHIAAAADKEEREAKAKAAALLVQHGADLEQVDIWGGTPLAVAQLSGNSEVALILVEAGASLVAKGVNVQRLLFEAVKLKDVVAAERLVSQGNANVMVRNEQGRTALDLAKESGSGEMMQVVKSSSTFFRDPDDEEHEGNKSGLNHGAHSIFPMPDNIGK